MRDSCIQTQSEDILCVDGPIQDVIGVRHLLRRSPSNISDWDFEILGKDYKIIVDTFGQRDAFFLRKI